MLFDQHNVNYTQYFLYATFFVKKKQYVVFLLQILFATKKTIFLDGFFIFD